MPFALQNRLRGPVVRVRVGTIVDVRIAFEGGHYIPPGTPRSLCQLSADKHDSGRVLIVHYRAVSVGLARLSTINVPIGHIDNLPLRGTIRVVH